MTVRNTLARQTADPGRDAESQEMTDAIEKVGRAGYRRRSIRFVGSGPSRISGGSGARLRSVLWLGPILLVSAIVQSSNLAGAPAFTESEGTVAAKVWSSLTAGAPPTLGADTSPIGAGQLAGWVGVSRGFERYDSAIAAAREPMVAVVVLSVLLLWMLVRRLGYSRVAASGAALVFALSPLAVGLHRMVLLDNLATAWMLLALVCALTERRQLRGFAISAAAAGIAVLCSGWVALLVPLVAWLMIRAAEQDTRRYVLSVAATTFALVISGYLVVAVLLSGPTVAVRGFTTAFSEGGWALAPGSADQSLVMSWFMADPVLVVISALALVAGLAVRRLRVLAILELLLFSLWLLPGGVAVVSPLLVLPLAAVLIAGLAEWSVLQLLARLPASLLPQRPSVHPTGRQGPFVFTLAVGGVVAVLVATVIAVPLWGSQLSSLYHADRNAPVLSAEKWIAENLPRNSRLLVDNSVTVDLLRSGFAPENVVWAKQLDSDPTVRAQSPRGWRDADFILVTGVAMSGAAASGAAPAVARGSDPRNPGNAANAEANSTVVASFGVGPDRAQVSRINPGGRIAEEQSQRAAQALRASNGTQLFQNPGLKIPAGDRSELLDGRVDERITIAIGQLLAAGPVVVAAFPERLGESGMLRRQVVVVAVNGEPMVRSGEATAAAKNLLASLTGEFRAESARATSAGLLVTFSILPPRGLVQ